MYEIRTYVVLIKKTIIIMFDIIFFIFFRYKNKKNSK
jgi:hypothetical protein